MIHFTRIFHYKPWGYYEYGKFTKVIKVPPSYHPLKNRIVHGINHPAIGDPPLKRRWNDGECIGKDPQITLFQGSGLL